MGMMKTEMQCCLTCSLPDCTEYSRKCPRRNYIRSVKETQKEKFNKAMSTKLVMEKPIVVR